jgi:hypothetical protein
MRLEIFQSVSGSHGADTQRGLLRMQSAVRAGAFSGHLSESLSESGMRKNAMNKIISDFLHAWQSRRKFFHLGNL